MAYCYNIGNPKVQKQKVALRGRELVEITLCRLDNVRVVVVYTRTSVHPVSVRSRPTFHPAEASPQSSFSSHHARGHNISDSLYTSLAFLIFKTELTSTHILFVFGRYLTETRTIYNGYIKNSLKRGR